MGPERGEPRLLPVLALFATRAAIGHTVGRLE